MSSMYIFSISPQEVTNGIIVSKGRPDPFDTGLNQYNL